MFCKISKQIAILLLTILTNTLSVYAQFDIDWTGLTTHIIDESARSEVQQIFQPLSRIDFSDEKLEIYRKSAAALGLKNPTTVEMLMFLEHGIRPLTASPLPTFTHQKISDLGNETFRNLTNKRIDEMRAAREKNELSDYLSASTISQLNAYDPDGALGSLLKDVLTPQLALLLNIRPECIKALKKNPSLIQYDLIQLIPYFSYKGTPHSSKFKKKAIPDMTEWNLNILNDNTLLVSSLTGEIGRAHKTKENLLTIEISDDPLWLNCNLPESSILRFENSTYTTDRLGRIVEISFHPDKTKYKDTKKRQLKGKDIVAAKEESVAKPHLLIPKKYGGTETWSNVIGIANSKENKQSLKILDKQLADLSKLSVYPVTIRLSYNSSSDSPSLVQYFNGDQLICALN